MLTQKSNFKKDSDETIRELLSIEKTIDTYKEIIGVPELSRCMSNASYYDILKNDIEDNNYYKKKPEKLRKMLQKLEKERKEKFKCHLAKLKERGNLTSEQECYSLINQSQGRSGLDVYKNLTRMMEECDGITVKG